MRLNHSELEAVRQKVLARERSRAFKKAVESLELTAVCLVGWERPAQVDNQRVWPVRIALTTKSPGSASKDDDRFSPHIPCKTLEYIYVESNAHGIRMKDALEGILFGQQVAAENPECRGSYFNVVEFFDDETTRLLWWTAVLEEAQRRVMQRATRFDLITEEQRLERASGKLRGRI